MGQGIYKYHCTLCAVHLPVAETECIRSIRLHFAFFVVENYILHFVVRVYLYSEFGF